MATSKNTLLTGVLNHQAPLIRRGEDDSCWYWTGVFIKKGYGRYGRVLAHRLLYKLFRGHIDQDLTLDHLCRNKACVNPDHLEPVTASENCRRWRVTQTHCKRGHELDGDNITFRYRNGHKNRVCRLCHRELAREYERRKKAKRMAAQ